MYRFEHGLMDMMYLWQPMLSRNNVNCSSWLGRFHHLEHFGDPEILDFIPFSVRMVLEIYKYIVLLIIPPPEPVGPLSLSTGL